MHNFFPSKWFAVIVFPLLGVGLVVGLFFLYKHDTDSGNPSTSIALQGADQSVRGFIAEADRDKDGLKDWEETLWHTDPNNPDTDGDGTKDGDEVAQNRNPAVAGPNDSLDRLDAATQNASGATGTSTASSSLNTTQTVAQELFASYLLIKQSGKLDQATQGKLIDALSASVAKQIVWTPYTVNDLKVVPATPENIIAYNKQMAVTFRQFITVGKTKQNELILLKQALETKNYTGLADVSADSAIYQNMSEQVRAVPVPQDIATQHLTLANGFQVYANMAKAVVAIQQDPVKTITYIGNYQTMETGLKKALQDIFSYLAVHIKK